MLPSLPLAILLRIVLICINVGFYSMKTFWHYGLKHIHISFLACMAAFISIHVEEKDAGIWKDEKRHKLSIWLGYLTLVIY